MKRRILALTCSLAISVSLAGCGSVEKKKQSIVLENTLRAYENTIRWGPLDNMYRFLSPSGDTDRQPVHDIDDIRVVSYDVVSPAVRTDEETAVQTVKIDYLHVDEQRLKSLVDLQVWKYEADSKLWYLDSEIPEFR